MPNPNKLPQLLTISQTAELLSVHPDTLRNWDRKGILKPVRVGPRRDRRYPKEQILRILEEGIK